MLYYQILGWLNQLLLSLKKDEKRNLSADTKNYMTSAKNIYAAGDARRGQSLVVWAIREGREAALAIHNHLSSW